MSIVIGITGGVGCGKSTVLDILKEKHQASIIEADKVGHIVMEYKSKAFEKIKALFGECVIDNSGTVPAINRKALAEIVFKDEEKLKKLNGIIHPAVKEYIRSFVEAEKSKGTKYIVVEAALLIEAGYRDICDCYCYVYANENIRKKRLMSSRGYTEEKTDSIMKNQLSEAVFKSECEYIIDNNGDYDSLCIEIEKTLQNIENNIKIKIML